MSTGQPKASIRKKNISVRQRTYEVLKAKVLSGRFNPGERLTEEYLADALNVSRTPVREALHKLELEGLVKPHKKRGFCVAGDTREEIEELFDIRAVLEGYALRVVSQDIADDVLAKLESFVEGAQEAFEREDTNDVFKWNTRFHDTLHEMVSHKPRLHNLIVEMRQYVLRYRKATLQHLAGAGRTIDGHRKIILSLRLKDPDLCEGVMREHIHEAKADALQANFSLDEEVE